MTARLRLAALMVSTTALSTAATGALAMDGVVASIKPVHSLVANVMQGVGEPSLLVEGAGSPHAYALRPSQARTLEEASVVFFIGDGLETFLAEPLETLARQAEIVALEDAAGLTFLTYREGGSFEAHEHDHDHAEEAGHDHDHGHAEEAAADIDHDDHGHEHVGEAEADHDHDDGNDHDEVAGADHDHDHDHEHEGEGDHAGHDHSGYDLHLWLDPDNAKAMVSHIAETLAAADPDNAQTYEANAETTIADLDALDAQLTDLLAPVADTPFIVFHDAYHYFEEHFGLQAAGALTINPDIDPGAERVSEIQETVRDLDAACVFSEPQFPPRIVEVVAEGSNARSGVLDPLGADIDDGPQLYADLMRGLGQSFATCLGGDS